MCDAIISRKRGKIFNKIKSTMKVRGLVTSRYAIIIYKPMKRNGMHKKWPRTMVK
jgi:hypothetical protein